MVNIQDKPCRAVAVLAMLLTASLVVAREPAVPTAELRQATIAGLAELHGQGVAVGLAIADDERVVAIFIGTTEGAAIARALGGIRPQRPMTHELLGDVLEASGARIRQVVIDELRDGIYYATIETRQADGRTVWIDARPSDSLALAAKLDVPIRVSPGVIESAPDWSGPQGRAAENVRIIDTGDAGHCPPDHPHRAEPAASRTVSA